MKVTDQAIEGPEPEELAEGLDPYLCDVCMAAAEVCEFHLGYGEGWDAAVALMARVIENDAAVQLVADHTTEPW